MKKVNKFYIYFSGEKLSLTGYIKALKKLSKDELEKEIGTDQWADVFLSDPENFSKYWLKVEMCASWMGRDV